MLIPRYVFSDDYRQFYDYFLSRPHQRRIFNKGDMLWNLGGPSGTSITSNPASPDPS